MNKTYTISTDRVTAAAKLETITRWAKNVTGLPVWWGELYPIPPGNLSEAEEADATMVALDYIAKGGGSVVLLWGPNGTGDCWGCLFTDVRYAGGGAPSFARTTPHQQWLCAPTLIGLLIIFSARRLGDRDAAPVDAIVLPMRRPAAPTGERARVRHEIFPLGIATTRSTPCFARDAFTVDMLRAGFRSYMIWPVLTLFTDDPTRSIRANRQDRTRSVPQPLRRDLGTLGGSGLYNGSVDLYLDTGLCLWGHSTARTLRCLLNPHAELSSRRRRTTARAGGLRASRRRRCARTDSTGVAGPRRRPRSVTVIGLS